VPEVHPTKNLSGTLWRGTYEGLIVITKRAFRHCNICNTHSLSFVSVACHLAWPSVNLDQVYHSPLLCGVKEYLHMRWIICVYLHIFTRLSHLMVHFPNYMFFGRFSINNIEKCICSLLTSHILLCFQRCVYLFIFLYF